MSRSLRSSRPHWLFVLSTTAAFRPRRFLLTLSQIVLFAVVGGMQVLLWLDEMEKREKAAKEAGNAQAQGASDGEG